VLTPSRTATTIGALAACAVVGATSPVWATSSSHSTSGSRPATATGSADAATVTMLRTEIAKLRAEVTADHTDLRHAAKADQVLARSATKSRAAAAHWRRVAAARPATRTVVVTRAPANDPTAMTKRCHHRDGVDPANWSASKDPRSHHHCHHGDWSNHDGSAGSRH
jgi:hypothetical protein